MPELITTTVKTRRIALIAIFTALSTILDFVVTPNFSAGVWYGWNFIMSPITGILLGPRDGFIATLISVMLGHSLNFRETVYEFVFTIGAPICSMISGLIFRGDWRKVFFFYSVLFVAYFSTSVSWSLPLWGMWDCYVAYATIISVWGLRRINFLNLEKKSKGRFLLSAFVGLEADILFRIFLLVPCQTYRIFYGLTSEALKLIWAVPAALITPIKVVLSTMVTTLIGPPLINILKESNYQQLKGSK